jgi:diacylglycerol kinase
MSIKKRILSFKYAIAGVVDLFKTQPNARIHLFFTIIALCLGSYFQLSLLEWALIWLCIGLVFSMEALNTAIEHLTDLVSPEYHPLAGRAKDVAAAAVLLSAIGAIVVGLIVFFPKIFALLN